MKTIGLNTTLHKFKTRKGWEKGVRRCAGKGEITEVFVNNGHAFEFKKNIKPKY